MKKVILGIILVIVVFIILLYLTINNWSLDMTQNLVAEAWGVFIEVAIIATLLAFYRDFKRNKDNRIVLKIIAEKHKNVVSLVEEQRTFKDGEDKFFAFYLWARDMRKNCDDIINNQSSIIDSKMGKCVKKYKIPLEAINKALINKNVDIEGVIKKLNEQLPCMTKILNEKSNACVWNSSTVSKIKEYTNDFKRFNE